MARTPKDTERFLRLVNEANQAIAARQTREKERVGTDPIRLEREQRRREEGRRRTREHQKTNRYMRATRFLDP